MVQVDWHCIGDGDARPALHRRRCKWTVTASEMVLPDLHCIGDGADGLALLRRWCWWTGTASEMVLKDWHCIKDGVPPLALHRRWCRWTGTVSKMVLANWKASRRWFIWTGLTQRAAGTALQGGAGSLDSKYCTGGDVGGLVLKSSTWCPGIACSPSRSCSSSSSHIRRPSS